MKLSYQVVSVSVGPVPIKAMVGDREIDATADGYTLDLRSADGTMCHTFRFLAEDAAAGGIADLVEGQTVIATLTGVSDE